MYAFIKTKYEELGLIFACFKRLYTARTSFLVKFPDL